MCDKTKGFILGMAFATILIVIGRLVEQMIVRVTFDDGRVMMFGDSYKPWTMQFDEYMWRTPLIRVIKAESCKDKWIGCGGLKWCSEDLFQKQLNREGCQDDESDNPNPRKYENMKFVENQVVKNKAIKISGRI